MVHPFPSVILMSTSSVCTCDFSYIYIHCRKFRHTLFTCIKVHFYIMLFTIRWIKLGLCCVPVFTVSRGFFMLRPGSLRRNQIRLYVTRLDLIIMPLAEAGLSVLYLFDYSIQKYILKSIFCSLWTLLVSNTNVPGVASFCPVLLVHNFETGLFFFIVSCNLWFSTLRRLNGP